MLGSVLWLAIAVASARAEPPVALASTPFFRRLGAAEGLPSSAVWKLAQDRNGYIWIGTADGLARYDGVAFRIYRHDAGDPHSISGDDVSALFIDRNNRLWCGGEDAGLNLLDAGRRSFAHFRHDANAPSSLGGNDVWAIAEDARGAIWIGGYAGGLDRFDEATQVFEHFRHGAANADSPSSDNVLALSGDRRGNLWIGTDAGVDVRGADGHFAHVELSTIAPTGKINAAVFREMADGMLVGTRIGLLHISPELRVRVVEAERLHDKIVYAVTDDAEGAI